MANITGTSGNDSLVGTSVADTISGLDGHDTLVGNAGNDTLNGGLGNDRYVVGTGDVLSDAGGSDTIETSITWHLAAGFENLVATGTASTSHGGNNLDNQITGNDGANWISGREGNDTLSGGGGGDTFNMSNGAGASYGNDWIDGGTGVDTLDYGAAARSAISVNLDSGWAGGGGTDGQGWAQVLSIENVNGSGFDDRIIGNGSANFLYGFNGNDTLEGGTGNDRLEGAAGNDLYVFAATPGAAHADTIVGFASGADRILLDGNGVLHLGPNGNFSAGDARFWAAAGATSGHDADDRLVYNTTNGNLYYDGDGNGAGAALLIATLQGASALAASDIQVQGSSGPVGVVGTEGNDDIDGTPGNDTIDGRGGNDTISGFDGNDSLLGGSGDDVLSGDLGADTVDGGAGNDWLSGSEGYWYSDDVSNHLVGGDGHDTLVGGQADDSLVGGNGDDMLDDFWGADTMDGGLGNDTYWVHAGWSEATGSFDDDVLVDAGGIDTIVAFMQDWTLAAGFENVRLEWDWDAGSAGDRILIGNSLDNHIDGRGALSAHIEGHAGNDTLLGATGSRWGGGEDASNWIDGGAGNDVIEGSNGNDTLFGGSGNDHLDSAGGADVLDGGAGNDTLAGGASPDSFFPQDDVFRFSVAAGEANADRLVDFESGTDKVELNASAHAGIGAGGAFAADDARFWAAAGATSGHDADDRVIYNLSTGDLYYDADGSGSGAALRIATLQNAPTLVAADILVSGTAIEGTAGDDSITGTSAPDMIDGRGGNDTILGMGEADVLIGGLGNDSLDGGVGGDQAYGGDGNDTLVGTDNDSDTLDGGLGDDRYLAGEGDVLFDAGGTDHVVAYNWTLGAGFENLTASYHGVGNELDNVLLSAAGFAAELHGADGNDTLEGAGSLRGEAGNDLIRVVGGSAHGGDGNDLMFGGDPGESFYGGRGNDTMSGGAGEDYFLMYGESSAEGLGYGQDRIDGGAGVDWVSFGFDFFNQSGIVINLAAGTLSGGGLAGDSATLVSIENVVGTQFADVIIGDASANLFYGYDGDDRFDGGVGNDTISGLGGADRFDYTVAPGAANADLILGFASGVDAFHLDANAMSALGTSGRFAAGDARFASGAGFNSGQDASDRVVYNTTTGQLWYDADGNASGAAQLIATLSGQGPLAATDIVVENGSAPPPPPTGGQTLNGTTGNDTLTGGAGNDTINGLAGADMLQGLGGNDSIVGATGWDTLQGGDGNDWLHAGAWSDTMTGGAGADSFVWTEAGSNNRDTVTDFASGTDELLFENGTLTAMGAAGAWAAGDARFWSAAGATSGHDTDDRLIYNTTTGNLYYDADGSGAGAAQVVATFTGAPGIAATDITVI